jgi:opacity protein-like surface antigen
MRTTIAAGVLAAMFISAAPARSDAQTFITPFAGATFRGDSAGERLSGGASVLFMGAVAGLELEAGFTPDFFGEGDLFDFDTDGNVTSLSANLLLGLGAGPVRPYVTGGVGLLRSRITSAGNLFDDVSENDLGVNAGAGMIVMFSDHAGLRGDVRYFRGIQDIDVGDLSVALGNLDFWRAYAGLTFGF